VSGWLADRHRGLAARASAGPHTSVGRRQRLAREPRSDDIVHDRAALCGDPRNDENTIIAQLHLAFLKAHNALVDQGLGFAEARRMLRQHYQHLVIHDFLRRVADPAVVDDILAHGNRWYNTAAEPFFCRWSSAWPGSGSATPWSATTMTST
jgi:hypothetical protein